MTGVQGDGVEPDEALARVRPQLPGAVRWRIAVVGLGSVGSQIADSLVRNGVRHLTLVDPDRVAAANLSRSVYRRADVDRLKVDALSDHLRAVAGPMPELHTLPRAVADVPDDRLAGCDLVVLATDDIAAELTVNRCCYRAGTAMVSVKLFRGAQAAELAWVAPHLRSPCLRCLTVGRAETGDRDTDYGTGRLVAEPALGPDIAVIVPQGARTALSLLAARDRLRSGATGSTDPSNDPARWFDHLARQGKVLAVTANTPGWGLFGQLDDPLWGDPWATVWVAATRRPDCLICGPTTLRAGSASR